MPSPRPLFTAGKDSPRRVPLAIATAAQVFEADDRDGQRLGFRRETFTGQKAAQMGLVNRSVPRAELREVTRALAGKLLEKNPVVLRAAKHGFKRSREQGLKQFLDDQAIKPGLQAYKR